MGEKSRETIYSDSPVDMARRWADAGATYLHVVDLDGAFDGTSENEGHIGEIVKALKIPVEVGGGIRDLGKAARLVELGVERVIVGTKALESREFLEELVTELPGRINVGVDAREGMVAVKGWTETSDVNAEKFIISLNSLPVGAIIYTDISRDGAMAGANIDAMRQATKVTSIPIIASGGVTSVNDILALKDLPLFGIIIGKALYEGELTLEAAMNALGA